MSTQQICLPTLNDTRRLGLLLAEKTLPGDVICLDGDLGAGKTALTQQIALGLDVPPSCYVTSPSFALFQEYPGRIPLYHMDFYRLSSEEEVVDIGLDEFFFLSGLTVIEWSVRAGSLIPDSRLLLNVTIAEDLSRIVKIDFGSGSWEKRLVSELKYFRTG